jgi:hypothetical protein
MSTKVVPLSDLEANPRAILTRCFDHDEALIVELPDRGLVSIRPVDADDDLVDNLIAHNPAFRALLERSLASPREPFPFPDAGADR